MLVVILTHPTELEVSATTMGSSGQQRVFHPVTLSNLSPHFPSSPGFSQGKETKETAAGSKKQRQKSAKPKHIKTVVFSMGSLDKSSGSEVLTIDVFEAKNLLQSGYGYIDVRTVEEYKKGHVDGEKILNIPYMFNTPEGRVKNPEFLKEASSLCKEDDRLVVGCQSGVRSLYATADLLAIGFKNVRNMGGGYVAWVENGFLTKAEEPAKVEEKPKEEL